MNELEISNLLERIEHLQDEESIPFLANTILSLDSAQSIIIVQNTLINLYKHSGNTLKKYSYIVFLSSISSITLPHLIKIITQPSIDYLEKFWSMAPQKEHFMGQRNHFRSAIMSTLSLIGAPAIEPLIDRFFSCRPREQFDIICALADLVHSNIARRIDLKLAILNDSFVDVEKSFFENVIKNVPKFNSPTPKFIEFLTKVSYSEEAIMKLHSLNMLYSFGEAAIEPFISLMNDPACPSRAEAANRLGHLADKRALAALENIVATETDEELLKEAHKAIKNIQNGD